MIPSVLTSKAAYRPTRPRILCLAKVSILALFLVFAPGCEKHQQSKTRPPPKVTVARPVQQAVTDYLEMIGNLQSYNRVSLVARVPGFLQSIHFEDGALVEQGQLLFVIEPEPFRARLKLAEATVQEQEATLARARQEYQRQQELLKKKAASESTVEQWRAEMSSAEAMLKKARADTELARIDLGYTRVKAPFEGRMERHLVDPGNLVGAGSPTELATIYRLDPIYAYFTLNERDLIRLLEKVRQEKNPKIVDDALPVDLGLRGEQHYTHHGHLDYASAVVDQTTGTVTLRALFANPMVNGVPALLPGMFVQVRIPIAVRKNALLVPEQSLEINQGRPYLLIVNGQNVVEQRPVTLGKKVEELQVIETGLQKDDSVIVAGLQRAHAGAKVTPVTKGASSDSAESSSKDSRESSRHQ